LLVLVFFLAHIKKGNSKDVVEALPKMISEEYSITGLDLSRYNNTKYSYKKFLEMLNKRPGLKYLNLSGNNINEETGYYNASSDLLKILCDNKSLTELVLSIFILQKCLK